MPVASILRKPLVEAMIVVLVMSNSSGATRPQDAPWKLGIVLGDCWRVLRGHGQALNSDVQQRFVEFCLSAFDHEAPIKDRVELALALGRIGNPRVPSSLNDPQAWVELPAGTYQLGEADNHDALTPETFTLSEPVKISRYLVTNQQFAGFIEAGGYLDQQYWQEAGAWEWRKDNNKIEPDCWRDAKWNGPTQPVVGVSWYEAAAFCRWAGCRLPSEREWEAAARGPESTIYPWGNKWEEGRCNSREADLGCTSPVGSFPRGRSWCGAEDMSGNAWEWCVDLYDAQSGGSYRVNRGGGWYLTPQYCRSALRYGLTPDYRYNDLGFRVLRSSESK